MSEIDDALADIADTILELSKRVRAIEVTDSVTSVIDTQTIILTDPLQEIAAPSTAGIVRLLCKPAAGGTQIIKIHGGVTGQLLIIENADDVSSPTPWLTMSYDNLFLRVKNYWQASVYDAIILVCVEDDVWSEIGRAVWPAETLMMNDQENFDEATHVIDVRHRSIIRLNAVQASAITLSTNEMAGVLVMLEVESGAPCTLLDNPGGNVYLNDDWVGTNVNDSILLYSPGGNGSGWVELARYPAPGSGPVPSNDTLITVYHSDGTSTNYAITPANCVTAVNTAVWGDVVRFPASMPRQTLTAQFVMPPGTVIENGSFLFDGVTSPAISCGSNTRLSKVRAEYDAGGVVSTAQLLSSEGVNGVEIEDCKFLSYGATDVNTCVRLSGPGSGAKNIIKDSELKGTTGYTVFALSLGSGTIVQDCWCEAYAYIELGIGILVTMSESDVTLIDNYAYAHEENADWCEPCGLKLDSDASVVAYGNEFIAVNTLHANLESAIYLSSGDTLRLGNNTLTGYDHIYQEGPCAVTYAASDRLPAYRIATLTSADSPYSVASTPNVLLCNCTGDAINITLPYAIDARNRDYIFKKIDDSTNIATLLAQAGENIDGVGFKEVTVQYQSVRLLSDGTNWHIIG